MRVLLVEDEPKVSAVIADTLKVSGFVAERGDDTGRRHGIRCGRPV